MSPLKIANLMAKAAQQKAQKPSAKNPDPDHDGDNDMSAAGDTDHDFNPAPAKPQSKKVAAMKEQEAAKGKFPPKSGAKAPIKAKI